ncbi:glycosyltransferase family 9 protein [Arcticibacter eurypsychrophilus]|uniref:glycosyltransferase family 9 protein n=1 Tax=Arcticibacter eurypsychrophilus TaxID=1434752 RepID=UPI00147BE16D|nr:glycosyltransferase family 9 protein [Arcticibacter eurypsychrophilus]
MAKFRKSEKRILLVKIDAIGDYILFRNFIEVLKNSEEYKDHKIELLGNIVWKDLALEYDNDFISEFYFIKEDPLYVQPSEVLKLGWMLFKRRYEVVIHSTYSRSFMGTGLAALAAGKENIAYDYERGPVFEYKRQTDKFHTRLIQLPKEIFHEYDRNLYFFEKLLDQPSSPINGLSLPISKTTNNAILVFPGSSYYKRNWERENFLEIIKRLLTESSKAIIIAGGPSEVPVASYLTGHLPPSERLTDLTGKITLPQLVQLIADSELVISNETSAAHIAAACKTPVICIQGGGHFERFTPYPDTMNFRPICIFEIMPCYNCDWNCKYHNDFNEPFPCILKVSIEKVWLEISRLI